MSLQIHAYTNKIRHTNICDARQLLNHVSQLNISLDVMITMLLDHYV